MRKENDRVYGQPYYDENGILHSGFEEDEYTAEDEYTEEYERQMEDYRRMYGDFEEVSDETLEFHPYEEMRDPPKTNNRQGQTDGYRQRSGNTPAQNQRPQSSGQRQSSSHGGNTYGGKNKSSGSSKSKNSKSSGGKKKFQRLGSDSGKGSKKSKKSTGSKNSMKKSGGGFNKGKTNNRGKQAGNAPKQNRQNDRNYGKTSSVNKAKGKNAKMENKAKHPVKKFFKILLIILLILVILANALILYYISKVNKLDRGTRTITNASIKSNNVRNILVIGSDSRDPKANGRTDTIILLSINKSSKEIIMTSFMRDMYVNIKGKTTDGEDIDTWEKINAAYVHGGAELLMDTIEYNFDVEIDDYVYFGFDSFIDIVDAVGGVEITVSDEEAEGMKPQTMEINDIMKRDHEKDVLEKGGTYNMNGYQALAYARLRYVGNADFQRTERQREVMNKIIDKVKTNPLKFNSFGSAAAENISTNMSTGELYALFYKCLFSMGYDMKDLRLPDDNEYEYGNHNGQSTLDVDLEACKKRIQQDIYK